MEIKKKSGDYWKVSGGAVFVEESTIERWVKECVSFLKANPDRQETYIRSGNTMVTVFRHFGCSSIDNDTGFRAIISKDYEIWEVEG